MTPPKSARSLPTPRAVWLSFWVQLALIAVGLVRVFVIRPGDGSLGTAIIGSLVATVIPFAIGLAILRGADWARILVTVLVGGEVVFAVIQILFGPRADPFSYVAFALRLVTVGLLWVPSARPYFRAVKAVRAALDRAQAESSPS